MLLPRRGRPETTASARPSALVQGDVTFDRSSSRHLTSSIVAAAETRARLVVRQATLHEEWPGGGQELGYGRPEQRDLRTEVLQDKIQESNTAVQSPHSGFY